ncbi:MAG: sigma-70 family RNA polymerase sigma factor [Odoribacter sp.]
MLIEEKDFQGFVEGDQKSFEVIFRQYYKTLVSFSMRYGLKDLEAEDVAIETLQHIWEIRKEIKSAAALHSLLFIAVKNRALNLLRNIKNQERIVKVQEEEKEEEIFYDRLMEEEMCRILDQAIGRLPAQCQQVVLSLLGGKSTAEIALEMQISINSVRTYKMRAIDLLRSILRDTPLVLLIFLSRISG